MIHRIKITENSDGTERGTQNQLPQILLLTGKAHVIPFHQNECKEKCHQIPEKAFLDKRQIAGEPHKGIHPCKTKRRQNDADHALLPVRQRTL